LTFLNYYSEQELQLSELQLLQELPPPENPGSSELQTKAESARRALPPQLGQAASSPDWLMLLSNSNFEWHLSQTYSYIGIIVSKNRLDGDHLFNLGNLLLEYALDALF
jgi:hypothetical protein